MERVGITSLKNFYKSDDGRKVVYAISEILQETFQKKKILAIGFCGDFLDSFETESLYYAIPNSYELTHWPKIRPFKTVIVDETFLPFSPNTWDIVIAIHYLEFSDKNLAFLNETYRILKKDGKLIVILFNKSSSLHRKSNIKHSVKNVISSTINASFCLTKISGIDERISFWPYNFNCNINRYNEIILNFFPIFSDIVVIFSDKNIPATETIGSLKEQYEMI